MKKLIISIIVLFIGSLGCDNNTGNVVDKIDLASKKLHDEDKLKTYIDNFPREKYKIAEVPGVGKFYIDDNPALVKRTLLKGYPWEPHVIKTLKKYIDNGATVIDIGAHIGSLTVPMAHMVGPKGRIFAFEPQKKIYRELVYNLRLNKINNVVPIRFALGSKLGIVNMDPVDKYDGRVAVGEGGDEVELRTLDSFNFSNVSLIKIDVEGFEAEVLRGAKNTINTSHPVIIIEIWKEYRPEIITILQEHGYSVRPIMEGWMDHIALYTGER
jgi:FkbM family methyltransferase